MADTTKVPPVGEISHRYDALVGRIDGITVVA